VPLIKAQRILGHTDPKLTAKVYSHLEADDFRDAVQRIEAADTLAVAAAARSA
jgi:integrase